MGEQDEQMQWELLMEERLHHQICEGMEDAAWRFLEEEDRQCPILTTVDAVKRAEMSVAGGAWDDIAAAEGWDESALRDTVIAVARRWENR